MENERKDCKEKSEKYDSNRLINGYKYRIISIKLIIFSDATVSLMHQSKYDDKQDQFGAQPNVNESPIKPISTGSPK